MSPQAPCSIKVTKLIHLSYTLQTQSQEIHRNTKEVCGKHACVALLFQQLTSYFEDDGSSRFLVVYRD